MKYLVIGVLALCWTNLAWAQGGAAKFKQLEEILPTPTEVRLASGAPGPAYWQQRADYRINVELDDEKQIAEIKVSPIHQPRGAYHYLRIVSGYSLLRADLKTSIRNPVEI